MQTIIEKTVGLARRPRAARRRPRCSSSTCIWSTKSPRRRPSRASRSRTEGSPAGSHHRHHRPQHSHHRPRRSADRRPDRRQSRSRSSRPTAASSASACSASRATGRASCTSSGRSSDSTQPGMTVVCGDSHTATHGAFGALAFGIGTSEVEHVLATQCLLQRKSKTFEVRVDGTLKPGVSAKDIILALIARIGVGGGTGSVFEYRGSAIRALVDGRAHDRLQHVDRRRRARRPDRARRYDVPISRRRARMRPKAPTGTPRWRAGSNCPPMRARPTTAAVTIDADALEPMITYGTNPGMGMPIGGRASRSVRGSRSNGAGFHREGAALYGTGRRQTAPRPSHRRGLHRELHQLADLRSARRPPALLKGPQGESEGARHGRAGIAGGEAPGRSPRGFPRSSAPRAATGASRAARCASP